MKEDDPESASADPKATPAASDSANGAQESDAAVKSAPDGDAPGAASAEATAAEASAEPGSAADSKDTPEAIPDSATVDTANPAAAAPSDGTAAKASEKTEPAESWRNTILWAVGIAAVLCTELFIYGHDGRIQVCVGVDTLTDYAIRAEPRTKENAKKHPFCAERLNLGMWSSKDDLSQAALNDACTAAARIVGQEHRQKCLRKDEPWTRFVEKEHIMPWDARLYRRLLWLD